VPPAQIIKTSNVWIPQITSTSNHILVTNKYIVDKNILKLPFNCVGIAKMLQFDCNLKDR
jgi:hypothetical protein